MNDDNDSKQSAESLSNVLSRYCSSNSFSKEGLREIFERHGLTPNNHHDVGDTKEATTDYKFFFRAIVNKRVTEEIIQYLLEYFPTAAGATYNGFSLLHVLGYFPNNHVPLGVIRILIDADPVSLRKADSVGGYMPLHYLCSNEKLDNSKAIAILKLFIEKCPEIVRHANNRGSLPIHMAAGLKPPEFCRLLIEAYPGSEQMGDADCDYLPLHCACTKNTVATTEYLYKLYPDAINHASSHGLYPIHYAMGSIHNVCDPERDPETAIGVVNFLLDCDPNVAQQKFQGETLLHLACVCDYIDSNIETGIGFINAIYDAHPEVIEDDKITSNIQECHQQVQAFLNTQLVYARQANDQWQMTTPDGNGQLPLHIALQTEVTLGSIKLLVRGNPHALQSPDNSGVLPLHIACKHHDSADVVRYLVDIDTTTLGAVDGDGNTALHHACCGAKYGTVATLLEDYDAVSVSRQNARGKLPIDLLWESNEVEDRNGCEYVENIFRLLKAYPETVMTAMMKEQAKAGRCSPQNERKRKFGK